ncbi:unnamed protein product, partial [Ixodes pacificus]
MEKKKVDTHCFAPGCKTGYPGHRGENGRKLSLFSAPKNDVQRNAWERHLKRKDKPLAETSAVCEKHFADHFVLRDFVHVIGGSEVRIPRARPVLAPDAVPTLLPDLPAYLSKPVARPRPERKRLAVPKTAPIKKPRLDEDVDPNVDTASDPSQDDPVSLESNGLQVIADNLAVPKMWTMLNTPDLDVLVYATTRTSKEPFQVLHERVLCFSSDGENAIVARCYLNGKEGEPRRVGSLHEARSVLEEANATPLCTGAMSQAAYKEIAQRLTVKMTNTFSLLNNNIFSKACPGGVTTEGSICVHCRTSRKALLTRKSRLKTKKLVTRKLSQRLKVVNQKTK